MHPMGLHQGALTEAAMRGARLAQASSKPQQGVSSRREPLCSHTMKASRARFAGLPAVNGHGKPNPSGLCLAVEGPVVPQLASFKVDPHRITEATTQ